MSFIWWFIKASFYGIGLFLVLGLAIAAWPLWIGIGMAALVKWHDDQPVD